MKVELEWSDDFETWEWGQEELADKILKPIFVRTAEIIKEEMTRGVESGKRAPYISTIGQSGELNLTITLMDECFVSVPLSEIEMDTEFMWILDKERNLDREATRAAIDKFKATLRGWIDEVDAWAAEELEEENQ